MQCLKIVKCTYCGSHNSLLTISYLFAHVGVGDWKEWIEFERFRDYHIVNMGNTHTDPGISVRNQGSLDTRLIKSFYFKGDDRSTSVSSFTSALSLHCQVSSLTTDWHVGRTSSYNAYPSLELNLFNRRGTILSICLLTSERSAHSGSGGKIRKHE